MTFVPIEELASNSGKSRRTVDRKLQAFKKENPEKFQEMTKNDGVTTRVLYSTDFLIDVIPIANEAVFDVLKDVVDELKPKKEKKERRPKEVPTEEYNAINKIKLDKGSKIIPVSDVPENEKEDLILFELICSEYRYGQLTFNECISKHDGVPDKIQYWIHTRPAFNSIYNDSLIAHKKAYDVSLKDLARQALKKMVTGFTEQLESVSYDQRMGPNGEVIEIPKERKMQRKLIQPSVNAIMFAMTNKEPDEWRRIWTSNPQDRTNEPDPLEKMTDAELMDIIEKGSSFPQIGNIQDMV
jgi:hypothetical protein